ncbi:hypothetical protein BKA56DRAFT_654102 [Ilyonectria sp. MPI-CAGE-AT-0026]|nr:hypothetical protein BKA56DRAFT_654102 [Ilyonectria sp. MPI-CAGE-AT-0026]
MDGGLVGWWFLEIEIEIEQPEQLIYQLTNLGALLVWTSAPGFLNQLGRARELLTAASQNVVIPCLIYLAWRYINVPTNYVALVKAAALANAKQSKLLFSISLTFSLARRDDGADGVLVSAGSSVGMGSRPASLTSKILLVMRIIGQILQSPSFPAGRRSGSVFSNTLLFLFPPLPDALVPHPSSLRLSIPPSTPSTYSAPALTGDMLEKHDGDLQCSPGSPMAVRRPHNSGPFCQFAACHLPTVHPPTVLGRPRASRPAPQAASTGHPQATPGDSRRLQASAGVCRRLQGATYRHRSPPTAPPTARVHQNKCFSTRTDPTLAMNLQIE